MHENKIAITITAIDMASEVIAKAAAEVEAAIKATKDAVITANEEMAASYRTLSKAAKESRAKQDASGLFGSGAANDFSKGAAGKLGLGTAFSSPYVAAGAAIVAATTFVVKSAADFQSALTRLSTSAGESTGNLKMVGNGILEIARDTGISTSQLTQAMYMIESGGQHGAAGLEVLKAAAQGAKTENADLATVADAVTSAMTDYHLPASQAADVTSKLVAATGQGKTTFQDLAGAMSAILPKASAAGISLNEILGDLASMTEHGISAQQASENLADAVSHLQSPTQAMSKEMAALGLNSTELSQHLGQTGLSGTIQEIAAAIRRDMGPDATKVILNMEDALKGLPPSVQALSQQVINGTASWTDWNKASKDLNVTQRAQAQSFATLYNGMHTIGTEQMSGAKVMQTYAGAMNKAMGDSAGLNVALMLTGENSQTTSRAIQAVTNAAADASGNVKGWTEIQGNFNTQWNRFKELIQTAAIQLGTVLLPALTTIFKAIDDVVGALEHFTAAHENLIKAIGKSIATTLYPLIVVLSLVKLAIGGVKDAIASVKDAFEDLKRKADEVGSGLRTAWDKALTITKQGMDKIGNAVKDALNVKVWGSAVVDAIKHAFDRAIANAPQWGRDIVDGIKTGLKDLAKYDIHSLINWGHQISLAANDAKNFGIGIWHNIDNAFKQAIKDAVQWPKDLWKFVTTGITQLWHDVQQWGKDIVTNIKQGFEATVKDAVNWGKSVMANIASGLKQGTIELVRFFTNLPGNIAKDTTAAGKNIGQSTVNGVKNKWTDVGELRKIGDAILKGIAIAIAAVLAAIVVVAVSVIIAMVNGMIDAITKWVPHIRSVLQNEVVSALNGAGSWLYDTGRSIVDGMINGARDAASGVGHAVGGAGRDIAGTIKNTVLSFLHIPGFAGGTDYAPGGMAVVGEEGPEIAYLPRGSQVKTAAETRAMLGGKGVIIQNLNVYNNTDVGLVTRQIGWQLANAI